MIWHSSEASAVLAELEVDGKKGLPNGVVDMRLEKYGRNVISDAEKPSYLKRFSAQLGNKTVIALIITALLSFAVSLMYDEVNAYSPLLIIAIVLINAAISAYYLHSCDNALDDVKSATNPAATVLRDGIVKKINSAELVPGDIIILEEGDYISADARLLESNELRCNETALNGEEVPVEKYADACFEEITAASARGNMVFSGTSVVHGTARAVVVATGLNTETGHTASILKQTGEKRLPLEKELEGTSRLVNTAVLVICALVFVIGMLQNFSSGSFASMTLKTLVNACALAVAAIPEGLPAIATVVIAVGIRRLTEDKIIIKDSTVPELLGKTSVICADKTGILTRNKMHLSRIFDGEGITDVTAEAPGERASLVLKLAAACSTLHNDPTEDAIKKACLDYNSMAEADVEAAFPRLGIIPFDSQRKTMTVISMINEKPFAIVKGAPEVLLPKCVGITDGEILKINNEMADEALRVVCIAMRPLESIPANPNPAEIEDELSFVGLLGLDDPPRDGVIEDISDCAAAGVRTVMITGDNLITAKSVARRIGILTDGTDAITGEELSALSDDELAERIENYSVYARISPADKLRIIKAWQKNGATVTVTGDGVQDAEALSAADVGCAMGKFGTDVARGTADVVISNSRFGSVACAVRECRGLFVNIRKSVHYLLSCNFAELIVMLIGMLMFSCPPLAAVQLLWINLLTDSAPAISLTMERAEKRVMSARPYTSLAGLFGGKLLISALQALAMAAAALVAFAVGRSSGEAVAMTMAFGTLGMSEIFHCYNVRLDGTVFSKEIFSNKFLNYSAVLSLFIIVFIMLTPAGMAFGMTTVSLKQLLISLALAILIVPVAEGLKLALGNKSKE